MYYTEEKELTTVLSAAVNLRLKKIDGVVTTNTLNN